MSDAGRGRKRQTMFGYLLKNFNKRHRVSVRERGSDREVWYMYISPVRILLAVVGVLLVMFAVLVTVVVYTPMLDALPGYPGRKAREMLTESIARIDSLEYRVRIMQAYTDNMGFIIEGGVPVMETSVEDTVAVGKDGKQLVGPSAADSLLRAQMEKGGRFGLAADIDIRQGAVVRRLNLVPPVKGSVVGRFEPAAGAFGTGIAPDMPQQVVAVQAGTVVMSQWTPEDGNMLQIQHGDGLVSVYKHNSQLLKRVGDRVEAGEAIGYVEPATDDGSVATHGTFVFELWSGGVPEDPQKYIVFQ